MVNWAVCWTCACVSIHSWCVHTHAHVCVVACMYANWPPPPPPTVLCVGECLPFPLSYHQLLALPNVSSFETIQVSSFLWLFLLQFHTSIIVLYLNLCHTVCHAHISLYRLFYPSTHSLQQIAVQSLDWHDDACEIVHHGPLEVGRQAKKKSLSAQYPPINFINLSANSLLSVDQKRNTQFHKIAFKDPLA